MSCQDGPGYEPGPCALKASDLPIEWHLNFDYFESPDHSETTYLSLYPTIEIYFYHILSYETIFPLLYCKSYLLVFGYLSMTNVHIDTHWPSKSN